MNQEERDGRHPQIAGAVFSFCLGLGLIYLVLPRLREEFASSARGQLRTLVYISFAAAGMYWFLRKEEGDFKALFLTVMILFVGAEAAAYFEWFYEPDPSRKLNLLLSLDAVVFGSLAVTAALADAGEETKSASTGRERHARLPLLVAMAFFWVLSALRITVPFLRSLHSLDKTTLEKITTAQRLFSAVSSAVVAGYLVVCSSRKEN